MSQYLQVHPVTPEHHLLSVIIESLREGAVIAYPTDSGYALGCMMGLKQPLERICKIRDLDQSHSFTLICRDLSEISTYAKVDNFNYRILKKCTPGGYTFILNASSEVPKLMQSKRKTVGIRVPDHQIALSIAEALGEPLLSTTLILPGQKEPLIYPEDVGEALGNQVDIVIDGGYCGFEPTTVVDLTGSQPILVRQGSGDAAVFLGE
jgi:tRNA threonylcarbamoyl adenosine modification protein (Sua5/YciO/YrdC/YwlC family)